MSVPTELEIPACSYWTVEAMRRRRRDEGNEGRVNENLSVRVMMHVKILAWGERCR